MKALGSNKFYEDSKGVSNQYKSMLRQYKRDEQVDLRYKFVNGDRIADGKWVAATVIDSVGEAIKLSFKEENEMKERWIKKGSEKLSFANHYVNNKAGAVYLTMVLYTIDKE